MKEKVGMDSRTILEYAYVKLSTSRSYSRTSLSKVAARRFMLARVEAPLFQLECAREYFGFLDN